MYAGTRATVLRFVSCDTTVHRHVQYDSIYESYRGQYDDASMKLPLAIYFQQQ